MNDLRSVKGQIHPFPKAAACHGPFNVTLRHVTPSVLNFPLFLPVSEFLS